MVVVARGVGVKVVVLVVIAGSRVRMIWQEYITQSRESSQCRMKQRRTREARHGLNIWAGRENEHLPALRDRHWEMKAWRGKVVGCFRGVWCG